MANLELWLTPAWLVALGVTLGSLALLVLWGVFRVAAPRVGRAITAAYFDGPLLPLSYVAAGAAILTLLAAPTMPWSDVLDAVGRLSQVGTQNQSVPIAAQAEDQVLEVAFRANEVKQFEFASNGTVRIALAPGEAFNRPIARVEGDVAYRWSPDSKFAIPFAGFVDKLYVTNETDRAVDLRLSIETETAMPQVWHVLIAAVSTLGIGLVYMLVAWLLPATATVAVATAKEAMGQPLYALLLALGSVALFLYIYIPYNTFGEDVKMLKDSGLSTILVIGIIYALWTASTTIADEIEGKTALTMLSKPVSRRSFIFGKFLGITWPLVMLVVVLGAVLLVVVSYKVVYDSRESSSPTPDWQICHEVMIGTVPGLVLALMEMVVLTAISVAISTRLSMLPNLIICGSIYVIGNLLPQLVLSSAGELQFVAFTGKLVAVLLPVLTHFNIQPAIAGEVPVPYEYLGYALLYCVLYTGAALLLALFLFEDRDLA